LEKISVFWEAAPVLNYNPLREGGKSFAEKGEAIPKTVQKYVRRNASEKKSASLSWEENREKKNQGRDEVKRGEFSLGAASGDSSPTY